MHGCLRNRQLDDSEERIAAKGDDVDEGVDTDEDEDDDQGKYRPEQKKSRQGADAVWNQMSFWYGAEWNEGNNQVTFDNEATRFAEVIVKACGEDPGKVTFDQMDKINKRVECLRCSKKGLEGRKRLVMNWTTAILHDINKHFEEAPDEKGWLLIGEEDTAKIKALEFKLSTKLTKWSSFIVKNSFLTDSDLTSLFSSIGAGTVGHAHSYLPLDTPMERPPYAVRI